MKSRIERVLYEDGEPALASLDRSVVSELNQCSSKGVMNDLLSDGLLKTPGTNCISLMTISGAKGSKVSLFFGILAVFYLAHAKLSNCFFGNEIKKQFTKIQTEPLVIFTFSVESLLLQVIFISSFSCYRLCAG